MLLLKSACGTCPDSLLFWTYLQRFELIRAVSLLPLSFKKILILWNKAKSSIDGYLRSLVEKTPGNKYKESKDGAKSRNTELTTLSN